jgi:alkylation response protein AidB-like acyl-CoA dehydrogenase
VNKYGTEAQKEKYLNKLTRRSIGSFCLSEAESGSDAFALKTTARQLGSNQEFVVNGSKMWISNAKEAEIFLVFANVDLNLGYKGITCFIFDKSDVGDNIKIGTKEKKVDWFVI